jgi:hypothetical protein
MAGRSRRPRSAQSVTFVRGLDLVWRVGRVNPRRNVRADINLKKVVLLSVESAVSSDPIPSRTV